MFLYGTSNGIAVTRASTSTLTGAWKLDVSQSDSLAALLKASGAPAIVAPALARVMDKDILHLNLDNDVVSLKYHQSWSSLVPFKLQSDIEFKVGEAVTIRTPNGAQQGQLVSKNDTGCSMIRHGPKKGEKAEDTFEVLQDSLIYCIHHTSPEGKETRVRRVYSRVLPAPNRLELATATRAA